MNNVFGILTPGAQWRFKPASDIFLVFNSNETKIPLTLRTWSLTLKLIIG